MYANPKSPAADQKVAVEGLEAVMTQLRGKDREFACSLIQSFNRYGGLTDRQLPWVQTLTQRAAEPPPEPVVYTTVDFKPIQDLFDLASKSLKRIKIKLQTAQGQAVVIHRAGAMSKYRDQILITDGAPFGQNKFFGRVDTTGEFFATGAATQEVCQLVKEFSENPADSAGRYGRLTGGCSFCNHGLKDQRSTQVGYGPVCAKRFGLFWG